jgi:hypothetical protein
VLSALTPDHLPVLVVAPKRVAEHVWTAEVKRWRPDLSIRVAVGSPAERRKILAGPSDIVVLGRDNIRDTGLVKRADPFKTLVFDELSGFKNRQSVRWGAARKLVRGPAVKNIWGLTGTPMPNGLLDLWPQIALIDVGERLGKNLTGYRDRYFTPGRRLPSGIITEWIPRPEADTRIHALLDDICLSMSTDGRVEIPPVTLNTITVDLPPATVKIYKKMKQTLVTDMRLLGGSLHTAANAAVLTNKLSQIAAGFLIPDEEEGPDAPTTLLHREKTRVVQEIVEGTGSPVLVFYRYRMEKAMLLETFEPGVAVGIDEPDAIERWNRGEIQVLLAHPASAGHGLNLQQGGHTVVWTTLPWSLEEWQQANKRVARQGQEHPVVIHQILARATVDQVIVQRLSEKATVQDALLTHLASPL